MWQGSQGDVSPPSSFRSGTSYANTRFSQIRDCCLRRSRTLNLPQRKPSMIQNTCFNLFLDDQSTKILRTPAPTAYYIKLCLGPTVWFDFSRNHSLVTLKRKQFFYWLICAFPSRIPPPQVLLADFLCWKTNLLIMFLFFLTANKNISKRKKKKKTTIFNLNSEVWSKLWAINLEQKVHDRLFLAMSGISLLLLIGGLTVFIKLSLSVNTRKRFLGLHKLGVVGLVAGDTVELANSLPCPQKLHVKGATSGVVVAVSGAGTDVAGRYLS